MPTAPRTRLQELDSLRGIAALCVVLYHYTIMYGHFFPESAEPRLTFARGYLGVYLFFLISGFVILMTINRSKSVLDFAVSRISRIYPAYWAAVVLTFVVMTVADIWPEGTISPPTALLNLTMLQRFAHIQDVDGVYWTLQYELVFYALAAGIMILGLLKYIDAVAVGLLALSIVYWAALEVDLFASLGLPGAAIKWAVILLLIFQNVQFFILGMLLYRCRSDGFNRVRGAILAFAIFTTAIVSGPFLAIMAAIFAVVISLAITGHLHVLRWQPLVFLGAISYTLYLTHQNLGYILLHALEDRGLNVNLAIPVAVLTMILIATALTYTVERPAMRLIRSRYIALKTQNLRRSSVPMASPAD